MVNLEPATRDTATAGAGPPPGPFGAAGLLDGACSRGRAPGSATRPTAPGPGIASASRSSARASRERRSPRTSPCTSRRLGRRAAAPPRRGARTLRFTRPLRTCSSSAPGGARLGMSADAPGPRRIYRTRSGFPRRTCPTGGCPSGIWDTDGRHPRCARTTARASPRSTSRDFLDDRCLCSPPSSPRSHPQGVGISSHHSRRRWKHGPAHHPGAAGPPGVRAPLW